MKSLTKVQVENLIDLKNSGLVGRLALPMMEKDIHLTDFLLELSNLKIRHPCFKGLKKPIKNPKTTSISLRVKLLC